MDYVLLKKRLLLRSVKLQQFTPPIEITYSGRDIGKESISIDNDKCFSFRSWLWFVPAFDLEYEGRKIHLEVRVWPWLMMRSFQISVESQIVYEEGLPLSPRSVFFQLIEFVLFCAFSFFVAISIIGIISLISLIFYNVTA